MRSLLQSTPPEEEETSMRVSSRFTYNSTHQHNSTYLFSYLFTYIYIGQYGRRRFSSLIISPLFLFYVFHLSSLLSSFCAFFCFALLSLALYTPLFPVCLTIGSDFFCFCLFCFSKPISFFFGYSNLSG
ncbi:hypothetical protein BZA70DRAFT_181634 [Myxozyma melibiosi]|uniref:Uncharacterized protein n=1 Tax=Myxozyma melibiosi TaxID=54550 RepID=A0ABR1F4F8_9ASCO